MITVDALHAQRSCSPFLEPNPDPEPEPEPTSVPDLHSGRDRRKGLQEGAAEAR
ncbi:hypothetical protein [Streptomyces sp. NPDC059604]|uniref:hypothetical protein n=1 Tax=Streptomyces sp. NPDC059604 TaxID=3346881 RepID=UPI0036BA9BB3